MTRQIALMTIAFLLQEHARPAMENDKSVALDDGTLRRIPSTSRNLRRFDGYYDYVMPFDSRELYALHRSDRGTMVLTITKKPSTVCILDESRTRLKLKSGTYQSDRPIATIIEASGIVVIAMRNALSLAPTPLIGLDQSAKVVWRTEPVFMGASPVRDTDQISTGKNIVNYLLDGKTGAVLDVQQDYV